MKTVCFGLLVVFWCNADKPAAVDSYCQVARPIVASRRDTAETLAAIRAENAKIRKLCKRDSR
jgi:hypothetical protein